MTSLAALMSLVATLAVGRAAVALAWRDPSREPGGATLAWGVAYPIGVLVLGAWLQALATLGVRWSAVVAFVPVVASIGVLAWLWRRAIPARAVGALRALGGGLERTARIAWFALLGWLALRFAFVLTEALARPPLPWEAWLDTAARGGVWYALRAPVPFVPAAQWTGDAYLAALPQGHALLPLLDVFTALAVGRFDDTVIHAPWPMFWLAQVLLAYGAMRAAGAGKLAALAGATLVGTLPLANAHAALGGTAALPLAAYLLAAAIFTARAAATRSLPDALLALAAAAGMVWASRAGALWLPVLLPIAAAAMRPGQSLRLVGGLVAAAAIAAAALVRQDPFARAALPGTPPGMGALAEQVLLLGNWHLLGYAALALAVLAWRHWREPTLVGWSGAVGVGVAVLAVFATSAAGRATIGPTGVLGHAMTAFAPLLALWVARVAWAWVRDVSAHADLQNAPGSPPAAAADAVPFTAATGAPLQGGDAPPAAPADAGSR
jgi:hypothetical protein